MSEQDRNELPLPKHIFSDARYLSDEALWDMIVATTDTPAMRSDATLVPACPPLHRFALPGTFSPEEFAHISGCHACQDTMSLAWRLECPSVEALIGFTVSPAEFPNREALELHVERDECARCARLLADPVIAAVASAIRLQRRAMAVISGVWREGAGLGALTASALRSAALGLTENWLAKPAEWLAPQPVMLSGTEEAPGENAETPFVTVEGPDDLQALLEVQHRGNLNIALSGLDEHRSPPVLALVEQTDDPLTKFVQLVWNEDRRLWTAELEGLANEFRVFILPSSE